MVPNPGFEAGLEKISKVKRLAWAWKGASQNVKERRLNALQAMSEGRRLSEDCTAKVVKAGGSPGDVGVLLIFASPENLGERAKTVLLKTADPNADSSDLVAVRDNLLNVPIGFVVCVLDRESQLYITSARPLVLEQPALALLDAVAQEATELEGKRS